MKTIIVLLSITIFQSCAQQSENKNSSHKRDVINHDSLKFNYNGRALPENVCYVVKEGGTERPFTGKYWNNHESGFYTCVACDDTLFSSDTKYNSGSGWPSFYDVLTEGKVKKLDDYELGFLRIEIKCTKCNAHLGHVFEDGPKPTGKRYCVNSASLNFLPLKTD